MDPRLLQYYNRELQYVRELGGEFAKEYPKISHGQSFPPTTGGLYSVDGSEVVNDGRVPGPAADEGCLKKEPGAAVNNAFFCSIDDSVVWDRSTDHLIAQLGAKYGQLVIAITFAHEIGHAVQHRLGIFDQSNITEIGVETQADCAAGAFIATVMKGESAHLRATPAQLDTALNGFLQYRDPTPVLGAAALSHGNGFDRLSAFADGLQNGPSTCFSASWFHRTFTERPFVTIADYQSGGNETLAQVLDPNNPKTDQNAGGLQPDLNRFWAKQAQAKGKTWTPVKTAESTDPPCAGSSGTKFTYCPADNTTYYDKAFASRAYYSIPDKKVDQESADVQLIAGQPGDFALGTLFVVAWGMAVRHQIFGEDITSKAALLGATCYAGAYAKDINVPQGSGDSTFVLSPPDMDEATFAMLDFVGLDQAFGSRGTSGLDRIQQFVKGYADGLQAC